MCNAGHVPVVVVAPDGHADVLSGDEGTPLGVVRSSRRSLAARRLQPGSVLVMVTDGVVESRRHDIDHGISLLCERAAGLRDGPLSELVEGIAALADQSLHDDVTVVAARLR